MNHLILMAPQQTPEESEEVANELGADDYVARFFEFTEVDRKIRKAVKK